MENLQKPPNDEVKDVLLNKETIKTILQYMQTLTQAIEKLDTEISVMNNRVSKLENKNTKVKSIFPEPPQILSPTNIYPPKLPKLPSELNSKLISGVNLKSMEEEEFKRQITFELEQGIRLIQNKFKI